MKKEKIKVYLYTRASTVMQTDGYSLETQKTQMKAYCDYHEYEIAGEYEDAGMYGNKAIKKRKDGSNYKDFYYYEDHDKLYIVFTP